jgi:polyphosphate kinase
VETELRRRRLGHVVRLEVGTTTPPQIRDLLMRELAIGPQQIYETAAPLGLAALAELVTLDRPDLKHRPWEPVTAHEFADGDGTTLLTEIRRRGLLAHHPQ